MPGKRPARAQTVEEIFASVSTVSSSGLNPPPNRVVLTPRSAEGCLKHGINPESLRIRDLDSFKESGIDQAVQRMRHEAYSQRRHEYMKVVRAARKKLYSQQAGGAKGESKEAAAARAQMERENSSLIELEQGRLQKLQARQQKEVENMLQFELKMNAVAQEASRKMEKEQKRADKRERDKLKRGKAMAEERRMRDLQRQAQEDAEEEKRQQSAYAMFLKDKEKAEQQTRREKLRKIEAREREIERNRKSEEYREETAAILKAQQDAIMERLQEMGKAEKIRSDLVEKKRRETKKKVLAERKAAKIRIDRNLSAARGIEIKKREDFELKQQQVAEQRRRLDMAASQEGMLQQKQQELLARKRQMVLEETRYEEEMRKEELLAQQEAMDENLRRIEAGRQRERQLKKEVKLLNMQMKQDTVERMKRVEEYKRLETIRMLKEQEDRTNKMMAQKKSILMQRKKAGVDAKLQRDKIQGAMEKVKISKKWHQAGAILNKVRWRDNNSAQPPPPHTHMRARAHPSVCRHPSASLPPARTRTPACPPPPPARADPAAAASTYPSAGHGVGQAGTTEEEAGGERHESASSRQLPGGRRAAAGRHVDEPGCGRPAAVQVAVRWPAGHGLKCICDKLYMCVLRVRAEMHTLMCVRV